MIIGTLENGDKCVYDLPPEIKTAAEFKSLLNISRNAPTWSVSRRDCMLLGVII